MKDLIAGAIERKVNANRAPNPASPARVELPLLHLRSRRKLDLSKFDFDDLLA